jgi:hypothetical protein
MNDCPVCQKPLTSDGLGNTIKLHRRCHDERETEILRLRRQIDEANASLKYYWSEEDRRIEAARKSDLWPSVEEIVNECCDAEHIEAPPGASIVVGYNRTKACSDILHLLAGTGTIPSHQNADNSTKPKDNK